LGSAPPGLGFNSTTGILSGTPTQAGTYSVSIQAVGSDNPAKNVTNKYSLVVNCPALNVSLTGSAVCRGVAGTVTVTVSGGIGPYTVTLSNDGGTQKGQSRLTFRVTPSATTTYSVMSIQDSGGCSEQSPEGSATVTVDTPPVVTENPANQTAIAGSSVSFTAAASGLPAPSVQWQVSTNSGASFTNIASATSTTLTIDPTTSQSGYQYRAVFSNGCGSVSTTAATLTVYNICLKETSPGNIFQFNSITGQYRLIECNSGYTITGKGSVSTVDSVVTLTGSSSNCKVQASFNLGQLTGTATIMLTTSPGVSETIRIVDNTSMGKGCGC
jgi:hypothetical protein